MNNERNTMYMYTRIHVTCYLMSSLNVCKCKVELGVLPYDPYFAHPQPLTVLVVSFIQLDCYMYHLSKSEF